MGLHYILSIVITTIAFVIFLNAPLKHILIKSIPWVLGIAQGGIETTLVQNTPLWYISAMLICMLLLYYILQKNKNFYLYVFAPLVSVLLYGYMYNQMVYLSNQQFNGLVYNGLLRAFQGLCTGALCWLIYSVISKAKLKTAGRVVLTIVEVLLYVLIVSVWMDIDSDYHMNYAVTTLLPIAVAISFSCKSYISCLFRFSIWKYAGKLSLRIYLFHYPAVKAVSKLFPDVPYETGVVYGIIATLLVCVFSELVVLLSRFLWNKRIKSFVCE